MDIFQHINRLMKDVYHPNVLEIGCHRLEDTPKIIESLGIHPEGYSYWAFEPISYNIQAAKKTEIYKKINFIETAVSNFNGEAEMFVSSGNADPNAENWRGSSSLLAPKNHLTAHPWAKFDEKEVVKTITLDTFCAVYEINKIDFQYVDIQGAENLFIEGAQNALSFTKYLFVEWNNNEMYEGQKKLEEWFPKLPGKWEIVQKWSDDVLVRNLDANT